LALEIDGYGPHLQKITRAQFSDQWMRQNDLMLDGWKVLRFSFDDVKERPRMCEQLLQQFMGKWFGGGTQSSRLHLSAEEKEIIRFVLRNKGSVKPQEVCALLNVEQQKARRLLHMLRKKDVLVTAGQGKQRVYGYVLSPSFPADVVGL
jgi:predicted HTH transcriptional regulator